MALRGPPGSRETTHPGGSSSPLLGGETKDTMGLGFGQTVGRGPQEAPVGSLRSTNTSGGESSETDSVAAEGPSAKF